MARQRSHPPDKQKRPPSHWNAYRPTYSSPARSPFRPRRQARRLTPISDLGDSDHSRDLTNIPDNRPTRLTSSHVSTQEEKEHPPHRLWDASLDDLMGRTTRAYDLVIHYKRDCPDGQRWLHEDIAYIYKTGKHLHAMIRELEVQEREVAQQETQNRIQVGAIMRDAENVRKMCDFLQRTIKETEQVPVQHLTRRGMYRTDEEGLLYKIADA